MLRGLALSIYTNIANGSAFGLIQTPNGTSPAATVQSDILTFQGISGIVITGDSITKTVTFGLSGISGGGGGVSSLAFTAPSNLFNVIGSPFSGSSGVLGITLSFQNPNLVFTSPDGSTGTPSFRSLVPNDIPSLGITKIVGITGINPITYNDGVIGFTGPLGVTLGGTGSTVLPVSGMSFLGFTASSIFQVNGSPVSGASGSIGLTLSLQAPYLSLMSGYGSTATPNFRLIDTNDVTFVKRYAYFGRAG